MKRMLSNIMTATGITLVVLAVVALCYGGTVIFISAVFQALILNCGVFVGIYFMSRFEYRYPILETGLKLAYILAATLICGWLFGWYANLPPMVLLLMTITILFICICLDTLSLRDEVKAINILIEQNKK